MKSYTQFKRKALKNPKIRKEYEQFGPQFSIVQAIIRKRIEEGISQKELAKRIGTKQSAIARFESGTYNPTLLFIGRITDALDADLQITVK